MPTCILPAGTTWHMPKEDKKKHAIKCRPYRNIPQVKKKKVEFPNIDS